jgi:hypothetical protein
MDLSGWTPARLAPEGVEWVYTGELRFTDPFFQQTLETALGDPFALLFRVRTPLGALLEWADRSPGLEPRGFVFHLSRCGSTLVTQMLATCPRFRALSEPPAFDAALRSLPADERTPCLRALVSALGQPLAGETHLVLKLDSWSVIHLGAVTAAYPGVPWIFLFRDPLEVLVSQLGHAGIHAVQGALPPELFGLTRDAVRSMPREEYVARVLARICQAALAHAGEPRGCFVDYEQLPGFVVNGLDEHFGLGLSREERRAMLAVAGRDAKNPGLPLERDSSRKRAAATPEARRLAERMLQPLYERLRAC